MYVLCCNIACFIYHWKIYRNKKFANFFPIWIVALNGAKTNFRESPIC